MKKFICFVMVLLLLGCATSTFKKTIYDSTGKVVATTEATVKRPIFAASAISWTDFTGNINSASSVDLNQIVGSMLAGYLASQAVPAGPVAK